MYCRLRPISDPDPHCGVNTVYNLRRRQANCIQRKIYSDFSLFFKQLCVRSISKFLKPRFYFLHYSGYRFIANSEHSSQSLFHRITPVYIRVPKIFKSSKNVYYPVHLCFPCGHYCSEHITEDPPPTKSIQGLFKLSNIFKRDTGSFQTKNIS